MFACAILEDGYPYEASEPVPLFLSATASGAREDALSWFLTAGVPVTRDVVAAWEAAGRIEFYVWSVVRGA